jgi:uncharacterized protein DUF4260
MSDNRYVILWQRLEGLFVLAAMLVLYQWLGASWWLFAGLILVPDLSMLGYLINPRFGAFAYNLAHAYIGPALIVASGVALSASQLVPSVFLNLAPFAIIWTAHIAIDRALGYGLKNPEGFTSTHLGKIGRQDH